MRESMGRISSNKRVGVVLLLFGWVILGGVNVGEAQVGWKEKSKSIDKILTKWNKGNQPGGSVGVFQNGKIVYAAGFGNANLEYKIKNDDRSIFRIGSTSKQFTSACIVLLSQKGKLKLDDPLSKFFPKLPSPTKDVTVRQLMHHTGGVRDYLVISFLMGLQGHDYYEDRDVMNWLSRQKKLDFSPGDRYQYSNSGYWFLGQIVKKVSGVSMAKYAEDQIFAPLGMTDTHFHDNHRRMVPRRSSGYAPDGYGGYEVSMTNLEMIGDGGVFTTIQDMKKWDDAFYGSKILNNKFWTEMTTVGKLNSGKNTDYACGLILDKYRGLETVEHGGAFAGFRSTIIRFPKIHSTVVVLGNRADLNPDALAKEIADVAFAKAFSKNEKKSKEKKGEPNKKKEKNRWVKVNVQQAAGSYQLQPGVVLKLKVAGKGLKVKQMWNGNSYEIQENKDGRYQIQGKDGLLFGFGEVTKKKAGQLIVFQGGRVNVFKRTKEAKPSGDVKKFVGEYSCEELGTKYILEEKNGELTLQIGTRKSFGLVSAGEGKFIGGGVEIKFDIQEKNATGFSLDAGRANGFEFKKLD